MGCRRICLALVMLALLGGVARAEERWWTGEVVDTHGRWTEGKRRIVTDVTLRTAEGERVVVTQLGGHVDGRTLRVMHGPPRLYRGMKVRMRARPAGDAGGWWADRVMIDDVGSAAPFVRTTNIFDSPLYWAKSCMLLTRSEEGTTAVEPAQVAQAVAQARAAWNESGRDCTYITITDAGQAPAALGDDGKNMIVFHDTGWPHDTSSIAITNLLYVEEDGDARDGELIDIDIEVNNEFFRITVDGQGTGQSPCDADLAATLTHELGHALGFEHTCQKPGGDPLVDDQGRPAPICETSGDPEITEATMYASQACGETKKATLEPDDIEAMCAVYPLAEDPGVCEGPDDLGGGCGCGAGGGGGATGVASITMVALAMLLRRRRRA